MGQLVVEGLDGVGKSTFVAALASALGAQVDGTPGAALAAVRACIDEDCPPLVRQLFYATSVAGASHRMAQARARGEVVVYDRYWASTLAYDAAIRRSGLALAELEVRLTVPDLTVFLDAPLAVRAQRLAGRAHLTGEDHRTLDPDTDAALRQAYADALARPWAGVVLRLDASADTASLVATTLARLRPFEPLRLAA